MTKVASLAHSLRNRHESVDGRFVMERTSLDISKAAKDLLKGKLQLFITQRTVFTDIRIILKGTSTVNFSTGSKIRRDEKLHLKSNVFLTVVVFIVSPDEPLIRRTFPRGFYTFPFKIKVEQDKYQAFPASFSGANGAVQYTLNAYARDWEYGNQRLLEIVNGGKLSLTTKGYLDLSKYLSPLHSWAPGKFNAVTTDKHFGLKEIQASLLIQKQRFLPGENIRFEVEVLNFTDNPINRISVHLIQKINNVAKEVTKCVESVVAVAQATEPFFYTGKNGTSKMESSLLLPRNLLVSYTTERKTVEIIYFLQFQVELQGAMRQKLKSDLIPILIGTAASALGDSIYRKIPSIPVDFSTRAQSQNSLGKPFKSCLDLSSIAPSSDDADSDHGRLKWREVQRAMNRAKLPRSASMSRIDNFNRDREPGNRHSRPSFLEKKNAGGATLREVVLRKMYLKNGRGW